MNYEDKADRLPPEQVVGRSVLTRLVGHDRSVRPGAVDAEVSFAAEQAMRRRVDEDTSPEQGAPGEAAALELDAMRSGYRLGRRLLGPVRETAAVSPEDLVRTVEAMNVYALPLVDLAPIPDLLARHIRQPTGAYEEAAAWAWSFGLGIAVVETDLAGG